MYFSIFGGLSNILYSIRFIKKVTTTKNVYKYLLIKHFLSLEFEINIFFIKLIYCIISIKINLNCIQI